MSAPCSSCRSRKPRRAERCADNVKSISGKWVRGYEPGPADARHWVARSRLFHPVDLSSPCVRGTSFETWELREARSLPSLSAWIAAALHRRTPQRSSASCVHAATCHAALLHDCHSRMAELDQDSCAFWSDIGH